MPVTISSSPVFDIQVNTSGSGGFMFLVFFRRDVGQITRDMYLTFLSRSLTDYDIRGSIVETRQGTHL